MACIESKCASSILPPLHSFSFSFTLFSLQTSTQKNSSYNDQGIRTQERTRSLVSLPLLAFSLALSSFPSRSPLYFLLLPLIFSSLRLISPILNLASDNAESLQSTNSSCKQCKIVVCDDETDSRSFDRNCSVTDGTTVEDNLPVLSKTSYLNTIRLKQRVEKKSRGKEVSFSSFSTCKVSLKTFADSIAKIVHRPDS